MVTPRRLRAYRTGAALFLQSLVLPFVQAQDNPFDCKVSLDGGKLQYDLTPLEGVHTLFRTRDIPPTRMVDEVQFNLCKDLQKREEIAEGDQCAEGTRACLTMTNKKEGENDRVVATIPLAVTKQLNPQITSIGSPTKGINIVFHGSEYPSTDPIPQSFNISIYCDTTASEPSFEPYRGAQLSVTWNNPSGCPFSGNDSPPKEDDKEGNGSGQGDEHVGSGIGWFFLILLLAFVVYFVGGSYHNYSTYGATGLDMIPHRDFWRDVPYILRDIVSHLCSAIRPSRSGYIAV